MTRRYVDSFLKFKERNLSIGMLCTLNGFLKRAFLLIKNSSPSSYSLFKKLRLGISVILFMSSKPLEIIVVSGLFLCLSSFIGGLILLYLYFTGNGIVPGWTSILLSIVLFSGINLFFLGVIGMYIKNIFNEVKDRPRYIIQEKFRVKSR